MYRYRYNATDTSTTCSSARFSTAQALKDLTYMFFIVKKEPSHPEKRVTPLQRR